jgi:predicted nucleic acid-binding protein
VTPPAVLVDGTFLDALTSDDDDSGAVARDVYSTLVDAYVRHELRLRARADHLRPHADHRRTLLAPIESMSVARQYERAAARLETSIGVASDAAITLVMMKRERIRRIATFDPTFSAFEDIEVVGAATTGTAPPNVPTPTGT